MAGERAAHSLQATVLVNEAYLRLINIKCIQWQDRRHFFAMAASVMRDSCTVILLESTLLLPARFQLLGLLVLTKMIQSPQT